MKTIFSFITVLLAMAGCGPKGAFLEADVAAVEIAAEDTADHPVGVTASSSWIVNTTPTIPDAQGNPTPAWFGVRYDASDPGLLQIRALERNESEEARTGEIVVVSGEGLILRIPFTQKAMVVRFEVVPTSPAPFGARDELTRTLTVESNLAWEYEQGADTSEWLTVTRVDSGDGISGTLTLTAEATRSTEPRSGSIVLQPVNPIWQAAGALTVAVEQAGLGLVVGSTAMNDSYEIVVPAEGGEILLSVYSRAAWTLATDATGVTFDLEAGGADLENGINVAMTVTPNTSAEELTFTLTFESGGEKYEYLCRQQSGPPPTPEPQEET